MTKGSRASFSTRCVSLLFFKCLLLLSASLMPFGTEAKSGESPSVFVNARWNQRVKLLPNRGESAVNILEHTLNVLNPKNIAKLPGFISFA
ncbi:hypothetical protein GW915_13250, partial [bacterium]|nr:hypothetical protein [bacterium]